MTPELEALAVKRRGFLCAVISGCGTLPYVGEHPGTGFVVMLILTGGAAGSKSGWLGVAIGAAIMAAAMLPIYFAGAYGRTRTSERLLRAITPTQNHKGPHDES